MQTGLPAMIFRRHFVALWSRRLAVLLLLGLSACRTVPPLPGINLAEPGWTIHQGQAVWCPHRGTSGVAADVLLATNPDGRVFLRFAKTPLPLAVAQKTSLAWQLEFPLRHKRYAGRGAPPDRLIWFILPVALSGAPPPPPWSWHRPGSGNWRLVNPRTGESLEGFFKS